MQSTIYADRLRYSGIPESFIENHPLDERCRRYSNSIEASFSRKKFTGGWLILTGEPGTGKTSSACSILMNALNYRLGHLITPYGFYQELKDEFGNYAPEQVASRYAHTKLLVIDDFGKERMTEWGVGVMFYLLDSRFADSLPTIITTNYNISELLEKIAKATDKNTAKAFGSRLTASRNEIIRFEGSDMRWKQ